MMHAPRRGHRSLVGGTRPSRTHRRTAPEESGETDAEEGSAAVQLSQDRYAQMSAAEQSVLIGATTLSEPTTPLVKLS